MKHVGLQTSRHTPETQPKPAELQAPCRRGCCWSPYGHSTVRDGYRPTQPEACHCHDNQKGTK